MTWKEIVNRELSKDYMKALNSFLQEERDSKTMSTIYPAGDKVFQAFKFFPFEETKVVIIGQDPYHNGNATGLAFDCANSLAPSLANIVKETRSQVQTKEDDEQFEWYAGCLSNWADQGVLLLNTSLTVEKGKPASHAGIGWERFTKAVIDELYKDNTPKVFIGWGAHAKKILATKDGELHNSNHLMLTSAHPSPYSADKGFFGNNHFTKANEFLQERREVQIRWAFLPF